MGRIGLNQLTKNCQNFQQKSPAIDVKTGGGLSKIELYELLAIDHTG